MKVNFSSSVTMERAQSSMEIKELTQETSKMAKKMVMAYANLRTDKSIRASGKTVKCTEKAKCAMR